MDLDLTELAVEALIDRDHPLKLEVAAWARAELADPTLADRDAASEFWAEGHRRLARRGVFALQAPPELGGAGAGIAQALLTFEGLGLGCDDGGLVFAAGAQVWSTQNALQRYGTPEQQRRWLVPLLRGEAHAAFCMSEPGSGSDAFALATTAERRGASYVLDGHKTWATFAPIADVFLVFASTRPDAGPWGISAFLVDATTPGVEASPNREKLGYRTTPFGDVHLDGCHVPVEARLGPEGAGAAMFSAVLDDERAFLFAGELGAMERLLTDSVGHARTRHQFGVPIGSFQGVSHRLSEMALRHETARLLMYKTALLAQRGRPTTELSAMTKLHATEGAVRNAIDAMQVHGARGYLVEHGVERQLRDALGGLFTSGTSEVQRNIVARLLGVG